MEASLSGASMPRVVPSPAAPLANVPLKTNSRGSPNGVSCRHTPRCVIAAFPLRLRGQAVRAPAGLCLAHLSVRSGAPTGHTATCSLQKPSTGEAVGRRLPSSGPDTVYDSCGPVHLHSHTAGGSCRGFNQRKPSSGDFLGVSELLRAVCVVCLLDPTSGTLCLS